MPRIRSVHPSQWTDENFVECSFAARLLVISVRNETDDNGIFEWKPKTLKMKLFPADNINLEPLLDELLATKQVMRYEIDGVGYGMVRNFHRYQRPEKPKFIYPVPSILPQGYELNSKYIAKKQEVKESNSTAVPQVVDDQSPNSISEGIGTGDSYELTNVNSSEGMSPQEMISIWNDEVQKVHSPKSNGVQLTAERVPKLRKVLRERFNCSLDDWRGFCQKIRGSPWLMGENDRGWVVTVDWAIKPSVVTRILEGEFDRRDNGNKTGFAGAYRASDSDRKEPTGSNRDRLMSAIFKA